MTGVWLTLDPGNAEAISPHRWKVNEEVTEGYFKLNFTSTAFARRMTGNIGAAHGGVRSLVQLGPDRGAARLQVSQPIHQVNNLTDEPLRMHRDNQLNRIGRYDEYGRRYLLDVTMKF